MGERFGRPTVGFCLWRDAPVHQPLLPSPVQGSVLFPGAQGGAGQAGRLTSVSPSPGRGTCLLGWAGKGDGHPASLSPAQPHFQKFFLPVRRGKKSLGSLLGCREGGGQVGTRFPIALTGEARALGPAAWTKGPAQPWDKSGPQYEVSKELTSETGPHPSPCPGRLCLWLQNRDGKKEGLEIAGFPTGLF